MAHNFDTCIKIQKKSIPKIFEMNKKEEKMYQMGKHFAEIWGGMQLHL